MKNIFKHIAISAAVILSAAACDKWTEQEPLEFDYVTIDEKNPALYEAYLQSVRDYHATEHQVLIARFDNKEGALSGRADHVNCLPDSVDYVVLNNVSVITETVLAEVAQIRKDKGMKVLIPLDYDVLEKEYSLYLEDLAAEAGEEYVAPGAEEAIAAKVAWFGAKAEAFVAAAVEHGMDGVMVSYVGINPLGLKAGEDAAVIAVQEAFFGPVLSYLGENEGKLLFFQGNPKNLLLDADVLTPAKYIIVPAESVSNTEGFNYAVASMTGQGIPSDKFVLGVTAFDVTDETATDGLFSGDISAIDGASRWVVTPDPDIKKLGVCVNHAQFDYFNIQNVYGQINTAIATMNPSPVK